MRSFCSQTGQSASWRVAVVFETLDSFSPCSLGYGFPMTMRALSDPQKPKVCHTCHVEIVGEVTGATMGDLKLTGVPVEEGFSRVVGYLSDPSTLHVTEVLFLQTFRFLGTTLSRFWSPIGALAEVTGMVTQVKENTKGEMWAKLDVRTPKGTLDMVCRLKKQA